MSNQPAPSNPENPSSPHGVDGFYQGAALVEAKPVSFRTDGISPSNELALSLDDESWSNRSMLQIRDDRTHNYSNAVTTYQQPIDATLVAHEVNTDEDNDGPLGSSSLPNKPLRKQRFFRGKPVKPKNQHLPEHVLEFKHRRKARTVASAWTGGVVGFVSAGPLGAALGATAAYGIAKGVGKARERRLVESSGGHVQPTSETGTHQALYEAVLV